ncbi:MAG: hypothetical protein IKZ87_07060 [Actinomycetaceae bacterium]|nr:hypothetical protein [Actinomycetaceae bacterium]
MTQGFSDMPFFSGARIAVVGLDAAGCAAAEILDKVGGVRLGLFDTQAQRLEVADLPVEKRCAYADSARLAQAVCDFAPDIVIPSTEIAEVDPIFALCEAQGVQMMSELDVAWFMCAQEGEGSPPWLCITGDKGKTMTAQITRAIMDEAGYCAKIVGNSATPLAQGMCGSGEDTTDVFIVEVSSVQLRTTSAMRPHSSVCLNLSEEYPHWHGNRQAYYDAKSRIFNNVHAACVYLASDTRAHSMVEAADSGGGALPIGLTYGVPRVGQIGLVEDIVVDRAFVSQPQTQACELFTLGDISHFAPIGSPLLFHFFNDALAAAALARSCGVEADAIAPALSAFRLGGRGEKIIQ